MMLRQNRETLHYSLQNREISIPYIDDDGNEYDTGEHKVVYCEPVEIFAPITMSGTEAEPEQYGLSIADYEAVIMVEPDTDIVEGAIFWWKSAIEYETIGTESVPKETSADYRVVKVSPSKNFVKIMLKAINK